MYNNETVEVDFLNKKIMVFGAHPDDSEIGMGGTIKKYTKQNYEVILVDLTLGEMSSNGNSELRREESDNASLLLGVKQRINLGFKDRNISDSIKNIETIAEVIRKYQPISVYYPSSIDPHPDHVKASNIIYEAIFHAKLIKFESLSLPWKVQNQFTYSINDNSSSDFYIDISAEFEDKIKALKCYKSQFGASENQNLTRLNTGFLEYIEASNKQMGYLSGVNYAEGFKKIGPLIIKNIGLWETINNGL